MDEERDDEIQSANEEAESDDYSVSAGIYCLFRLKGQEKNIFAGFKCTDFDKTPNVTTTKEVRHQLSKGGWATHIVAGKKDAGELTVKGLFDFVLGAPAGPDLDGYTSRIKDGAQGIVMLAVVLDQADVFEVFFKCDANIVSDGGFGGTLNEVMTTETKFKLSGRPLLGTVNIGETVE